MSLELNKWKGYELFMSPHVFIQVRGRKFEVNNYSIRITI